MVLKHRERNCCSSRHRSVNPVVSPLHCNRVRQSSGSEPGRPGQYDTVSLSPLTVTGFLPVSWAQRGLLPHGSSHQGLFYLDWPGPWPLSTDSPIRLQESITGSLWETELIWAQRFFPINFVCILIRCACALWTAGAKVQFEKSAHGVFWNSTWVVRNLARNKCHELNTNSSLKH